MITTLAQLHRKVGTHTSMMLQAILNAYYGEEYNA
jgi:hypothetical protein